MGPLIVECASGLHQTFRACLYLETECVMGGYAASMLTYARQHYTLLMLVCVQTVNETVKWKKKHNNYSQQHLRDIFRNVVSLPGSDPCRDMSRG